MGAYVPLWWWQVERKEKGCGFCTVLGTAVSCPTCQYHLYSWSPNVNTWYNSGGVLLTLSMHVDDHLPSLSRRATYYSFIKQILWYMGYEAPAILSFCTITSHTPAIHALSKLEDSLSALQTMAMRKHSLRSIVAILFCQYFYSYFQLVEWGREEAQSHPINFWFDPLWISFDNFFLFQIGEKWFICVYIL